MYFANLNNEQTFAFFLLLAFSYYCFECFFDSLESSIESKKILKRGVCTECVNNNLKLRIEFSFTSFGKFECNNRFVRITFENSTIGVSRSPI